MGIVGMLSLGGSLRCLARRRDLRGGSMTEDASRKEFRRRVRRAYELAWQDRQDSGSDSVELLDCRLREANLPEDALSEGAPLRGVS